MSGTSPVIPRPILLRVTTLPPFFNGQVQFCDGPRVPLKDTDLCTGAWCTSRLRISVVLPA